MKETQALVALTERLKNFENIEAKINALCEEKNQMKTTIDGLQTAYFAALLSIERLEAALQNNGFCRTPNLNRAEGEEREFIPYVGVSNGSIRFSAGVEGLLPDWKDMKYVSFWKTTEPHVIAVKFSQEETKECVKLASMKDEKGRAITRYCSSVFAVNAAFGGWRPGDATKFYNAAASEEPNTVIVWPAVRTFALGDKTLLARTLIRVNPQSGRSKNVTVYDSRTRFSTGALNALGFDGSKTFCSVEPDGEDFLVKFSAEKTANSWHMKPVIAGGMSTYEVASKGIAKALGFDSKTDKSLVFSSEVEEPDTLRLQLQVRKGLAFEPRDDAEN